MFKIITIVLALALAGMGETSLMLQSDEGEVWKEAGVEASMQQEVRIPEGNAEKSLETDFNNHFLISDERNASSGIEEEISDTNNASEDASTSEVLEKEIGNSADIHLESDATTGNLIHLMINGQVGQDVQMHN